MQHHEHNEHKSNPSFSQCRSLVNKTANFRPHTYYCQMCPLNPTVKMFFSFQWKWMAERYWGLFANDLDGLFIIHYCLNIMPIISYILLQLCHLWYWCISYLHVGSFRLILYKVQEEWIYEESSLQDDKQ